MEPLSISAAILRLVPGFHLEVRFAPGSVLVATLSHSKGLRWVVPLKAPKGPSLCLVHTWALKGFLYPYFGVHEGTTVILGPFGNMIDRSCRD